MDEAVTLDIDKLKLSSLSQWTCEGQCNREKYPPSNVRSPLLPVRVSVKKESLDLPNMRENSLWQVSINGADLCTLCDESDGDTIHF